MAGDGFEALKKLENMTASLIVIDLQMPRMDGLSLLSHIQQSYAEVPVIVISATPRIQMPHLAVARNIYAYLEKPFSIEQLGERIVEILQPNRSEFLVASDDLKQRADERSGVHVTALADGGNSSRSVAEEMENLLRREIGEIRDLHGVYRDEGLDRTVELLAELGDRQGFGALRVCNIDNGDGQDRLLVAGPERQATVVRVGSEAPLTTMMEVLRYRG